ncbi:MULTISPECIES: 5-methyltetrahydropteroyltriglutamate--homocysteine methyltransferase [Aerococcus]|uniref:5-methyltetrahydropteroyltriglutamate--homocysteine methyltransferase n=1 Tax=Aerococcus sanguinicola TaxID=119206 RepID=A0A5N1GHV9_9LACT|nr:MULTISPECIES: 5-methyltetrahydropteroyltriglutamate--homocysteine methyltransferase [Aerococcus]KAA9300503.1 5-methyltetrahydropteroyltriglutamate--homocysteine methyltransferase [Aerococcus sanguinicola]MDK6369681.1 5-methyltetrahydropteroyltriglutamate--homocysteine methyltransferase [Aerococcus sp. UMB9870]MDK6680319.1 5-methyltetrahydropteroyltriglutamate--homocysteine methyltransferase [Aerococcus sp. UMB8608]MDK6686899.1 5-methyltetrahydropteroyltriglutamate--homocysteine methyltransfe
MTTFSKRFLTVGSLLRPKELLTYKNEIEKRDDITYPFYDDLPGYKEAEEAAVKDIVAKQVAHGLTEISDGEFQRSLWHLDFAWGLSGIDRYINDSGYHFYEEDADGNKQDYETRRDIGLHVTGKLSGKNHPFVDHFKLVKSLAPDDVAVKHTIFAPGHLYFELLALGEIGEGKFYSDLAEFRHDLTQAYKEFVKEYAAAGASVLQIDDCIWASFVGDEDEIRLDSLDFDGSSFSKEELANQLIDLNNAVADYAHELGLKVYGHNCRGNYASRAFTDGAYTEVAKYFLARQHYDRFYLEWDDERAGSLSALKVFEDRPDVEVVVGALSSKTAGLDDADRALRLLEEASHYVSKDNLYLSHQCGFASCDCGNELTEDQQWAKIDQGHEIAYQFFGE